jgi:hypothetical protein
MFKRDMDQLD